MELSSNALIDEIKSDIQKQMLRLGQPNVRYIKDMDRALVGSCLNDAGMVVPIYSNQMCIDCLAEQFSEDCPEQESPYDMAVSWFYYNTLGEIPNWKELMPLMASFVFDSNSNNILNEPIRVNTKKCGSTWRLLWCNGGTILVHSDVIEGIPADVLDQLGSCEVEDVAILLDKLNT